MQRKLAGSLSHLSTRTLLRLLSVAEASGVLTIQTGDGSMRLEIVRGMMDPPAASDLTKIGGILTSGEGQFRFEPGNPAVEAPEGSVSVLSLIDIVSGDGRSDQPQFASDLNVDDLLGAEMGRPAVAEEPKIHLLSVDVPENPLDDLLSELEATTPEELLLAQIGLVASNPRFWMSPLEVTWRRRGWQMRSFELPSEVPIDELDILIVHQHLSAFRSGSEERWLDLLERAAGAAPPVPSIWIGPVGDPVWVHRLISAGVMFLMPAPQSDSGDSLRRFHDGVATVIARQLMWRMNFESGQNRLVEGELLDVLLHGQESGRRLSVLLQLAAGSLQRAAVLAIEETAVRCRAGFGYPLSRGRAVAPRGIAVIERVLRSRQPVLSLDPASAGASQLAMILGTERLPRESVLIPLCAGPSVTGILVGDRRGASLQSLEELTTLAVRMGGVLV